MKQIGIKRSTIAGFTITELMLTLAVAAVILTIGVPSFQALMERNQLTTNINRFISSLALARSEAIKRNQRVVVCPSSNGTTCNAGGYDDGWIVFVDSDNDNSHDNGEELIWSGESVPANMTLRGTNSYNIAIPYSPSGRLAAGAAINGSVRLCVEGQISRARMVTIIQSGRVRLAEHNDSGVPLNSSGPIENCATS